MKHLLRVFILMITTSLALAEPAKISQDLKEIDPQAKVDVIVQFNQAPGQEHFQGVHGQGGQLKANLPSINGALFSMPARARRTCTICTRTSGCIRPRAITVTTWTAR